MRRLWRYDTPGVQMFSESSGTIGNHALGTTSTCTRDRVLLSRNRATARVTRSQHFSFAVTHRDEITLERGRGNAWQFKYLSPRGPIRIRRSTRMLDVMTGNRLTLINNSPVWTCKTKLYEKKLVFHTCMRNASESGIRLGRKWMNRCAEFLPITAPASVLGREMHYPPSLTPYLASIVCDTLLMIGRVARGESSFLHPGDSGTRKR